MPEDYGIGDSPNFDFTELPSLYTGPDYTYSGNYRADPNSPLYGGDGWIDPSQGGGSSAPAARLEQEYRSPAPAYTPPGAQPSGERGSPQSTYGTNWGGGSSPSFPTPTSMGTPPTPGRSGSFSGPNLPPAQFQRLNELLTNPGAITSDPGYKFLREQGEAALARTAASKKQALSGGADIDAIKWGQGSAMQYLNQLIQQLLGASNASRIAQSGTVGADPGTQGEFAARDLIPVIQKMMSSSGGGMLPVSSLPAFTPPSYGGYTPRLQGALDPRAETDRYLMNNPDYEMAGG